MTTATEIDRGGSPLRRILRENAVLLVLVAIHAAAAAATARAIGQTYEPGVVAGLGAILAVMAPVVVAVLAVRHLLVLALRERPERPIRRFAADVAGAVTDPDRVAGGLLALAALSVFIAAFTHLKAAIPALQPFAWDEAFAAWDRALHFGVDPWRITFALFGTPVATTAINAAYHAWLFLMYFVVLLACFATGDRTGRNAFLIGWVLAWAVGGNLFATVFSSAGPVYFGPLGLGDDFAALRATLEAFHEASPVWALGVQDMLWEGYVADGAMKGISAMPSMHVASSVLLALYGFRHARWAGWLLTAFAAVIVVGSVHLGWHYAIDSYAGILVGVAAWMAGLRLARWQERRAG